MEFITIKARLIDTKREQFFHSIGSLKKLVQNYCHDIQVSVDDNNDLTIRISFNTKEEAEENFYNTEFTILKGSIKSLCEHSSLTISEATT